MPDTTTTENADTEYRALIEFKPDGELDSVPWQAVIYADGVEVDKLYATTRDRALMRSREWVKARRARIASPVDVAPEWVDL